MDLYADLPLAKGAAADAGADGTAKTPSVWAKGVTAFVPGQTRPAPPAVATSAAMLPASLAAARARSPGSVPASMRPGGRGVSLAFRPASVMRKAPSAAPSASMTRNAGSANNMKEHEAPMAVEGTAPRGGLGFVAATTWTQVTVPKEPSADDNAAAVAAGGANTHFFQATYRDEYHPSRPNSYEAFCDERAAKKKMEQVKRELEERQREQDRESKREREQFAKDVSEGKAPSMALPTSAGRGRGMTVPAWMKKKIEESASKMPEHNTASNAVMTGTEDDQFDDAPSRGGLGFSANSDHRSSRTESARPQRDEFGRDVSGRDTQTRDRAEHGGADGYGHDRSRRRSRSRSRDRGHGNDSRGERKASPSGGVGARIGGARPGRVVLLQNMVGPGEVDDELEEEVKEECTSKYGPVEKCVVYEVRGRVSPEEAVRIFVQFRQQAHADQALNGLNSRFFGGRKVKASYYDETKFARLDFSA